MSLTKFDLSADYHTSDTPTTKKQRNRDILYTHNSDDGNGNSREEKKIITNETKSYTKCKTITILVETWPQITLASKLFSHLSCCHVYTVSSFWLVVCSYTQRERERVTSTGIFRIGIQLGSTIHRQHRCADSQPATINMLNYQRNQLRALSQLAASNEHTSIFRSESLFSKLCTFHEIFSHYS